MDVAPTPTQATTSSPAPPSPPGGFAGLLTPGPLPPRGLPRIFFGAAQPVLGLRLVFRERALRRRAALPALVLVLLCALAAYGARDADLSTRLEIFLDTMVLFAPVPVIFFGKTYRNLAADARVPLGLSPGTAVHPRLLAAIGDALRQSLLIALGLVPLYAVLEFLGALSNEATVAVALVWVLGAAWALHWIVVEALDNGLTAPADAPASDPPEAPDPWFVRLYTLGPLAVFARLLRSLSRPWRGELALVARHPDLALGFGLGIAVVLAVPLLALVFRPAAIVGAVHLLGRVAEAERPA